LYTEIANAVKAADDKAQYDERAKRLLSQKHILAHILVKTIDEFKGMNPKDVLLGLSNELPEHDEKYELHRLLGALLSKSVTQAEKLNIIGNEYDIPLEDEFRKELGSMCNLSQGIVEETEERFILSMYDNDIAIEKIAVIAHKTVEEVQTIIKNNQSVLV
jgi:hypothetical protein